MAFGHVHRDHIGFNLNLYQRRLTVNRRVAISLLAGFVAPTSLGVQSLAQGTSDESNIQWVQRLLAEMSRIRPGMRRTDLLTMFTTEGGLSTGVERTYVNRQCPYFKVDVTFQAVGRPKTDRQERVTLGEDGRDQILTISRSCLAFSVMD